MFKLNKNTIDLLSTINNEDSFLYDLRLKAFNSIKNKYKNNFFRKNYLLTNKHYKIDFYELNKDLIKKLEKQGVIIVNNLNKLSQYHIFRKYLPIILLKKTNKLSLLNASFFLGGIFIYIPPNIMIKIPIYFKYTKIQFERTIIIADKGSCLTYIEGCPNINTYQYNKNLDNIKYISSSIIQFFTINNSIIKYINFNNGYNYKKLTNIKIKQGILSNNSNLEILEFNIGYKRSINYNNFLLKGLNSKVDVTAINCSNIQQNKCIINSKVIHNNSYTKSQIINEIISFVSFPIMYKQNIFFKKNKNTVNHNAVVNHYNLSKNNNLISIINKYNIKDKNLNKFNYNIVAPNYDEIFYLIQRGLTKKSIFRLYIHECINKIIKLYPIEFAIEIKNFIDILIKNN